MPLGWNELRYKQILDSFQGYTYTVNISAGQVTKTRHSPGCIQVTRYTPDEYRADPDLWHRMILDTDRETVLAHIQRLKNGQRVAPIEHRIIRKDGVVCWVRNTMVPCYGPDGQLLGYDGLIYDITPRKQVELEREQLLATEREQRLRAETMGEVFLALAGHTQLDHILNEILQQSQRLVVFNTANIMLREGDQLRVARGYGYQNYGSGQLISTLKQSLNQFPLDALAIQSRRPVIVANTNTDPRWVTLPGFGWIKSFLVVPICLGDQVIGLLRLDSDTPNAFTPRDAERLQPLSNAAAIALENARLYSQAQQELRERVAAQDEFRHVANRNQAILNAIPDSMLLFDPTGHLHRKNIPDGDHPLQEFVTALSGNVAPVPGRPAAALVNRWRGLIDQVLAQNSPQHFEFQLPTPPVGFQAYEAHFVCTADGEVLVIVRNVTRRKQAEQQALHNERLAVLGQLAAAMAHEINNPLQAIQSNLDLVLDYKVEPEITLQSLLFIREEIERLKDTARRILEYARPQPETQSPVDLAALMEQVFMLAGNQLDKRNIRLTTDFQRTPPAMAAPGPLIQVFLNLLLNTTDLNSTRPLTLHIAIYPTPDHAVISFENNGPIIPPHILPHLFEPFVTTKKEGTGLGLWISRMIILRYQGIFTVENTGPERGVIFKISLPQADAQP